MGITLKKGDRRPSATATAKDAAGAVIDLTGATAVFIAKDQNGVEKVNAAATIVSPTAGTLQYDFALVDSDTISTYRAKFLVTFSDGKKMSVPNDGYVPMTVQP